MFGKGNNMQVYVNTFAAGVRIYCTLKSSIEPLFSCHFATTQLPTGRLY